MEPILWFYDDKFLLIRSICLEKDCIYLRGKSNLTLDNNHSRKMLFYTEQSELNLPLCSSVKTWTRNKTNLYFWGIKLRLWYYEILWDNFVKIQRSNLFHNGPFCQQSQIAAMWKTKPAWSLILIGYTTIHKYRLFFIKLIHLNLILWVKLTMMIKTSNAISVHSNFCYFSLSGYLGINQNSIK